MLSEHKGPGLVVGHLGDIHQEAASRQEHDIIESASSTSQNEHDEESQEVGTAIAPEGECLKNHHSAIGNFRLQSDLKLDAFIVQGRPVQELKSKNDNKDGCEDDIMND